ncbi:hypothetical protein PsorP6_001395 [Peronosclerospora sorghi]|uniref:Uncharacterized protein n=1 Tax=Peronosclerospora sorghi TaxID=230839 RepID=A0ACC0WUI4_9STRA|nr:hypothetical protein PsorP6_001395 [Peronosclerospora sorghi]
MGAKCEQNNLNYLAHHQIQIREELYQGLADQMEQDAVASAAQVGLRIVLPTSFPGSPRFMMQAYQDDMTIVRISDIQDVFLTFTCNPRWQEITAELDPGQTASDRLDLVARLFQMKKVNTVDDIDWLVSAELPSPENVELYETVTKCLLHGPCGPDYPTAKCMVNGV